MESFTTVIILHLRTRDMAERTGIVFPPASNVKVIS